MERNYVAICSPKAHSDLNHLLAQLFLMKNSAAADSPLAIE